MVISSSPEIWLRVLQMMKDSDIRIQEKKAKLFNEWEREDCQQSEVLNNLQPEWSRHVTIVHQTKDLHTADFTQLYDFLKYNQKEVNQNQIGNGNLVAAHAEGNAAGQNGNQIRCFNCRGVGIQLQAKEYDLMAAAADLDEIEKVNANYILMANLQQASTSGTQTDSALVYDTDGSAESRDKMKQMNKEIKPANYTKINHLSGVFVPQKALSHDTTPSVARKFLNEVKSTILTLQHVVKQRMTIETHNWASSAHQELYKIVREEIFSIVNQVDARVQNFEINFLKEAAKFVGDFKSLENEADASLAKHTTLELEIECLLKAVFSQDIMIIVQNESVFDTSDLQTELERTKERFENYIIKKETEYAKLWNDWYKKCDECKYDKFYTRNPLSQKLKNKNVELEFLVLNYARENAYLKAAYKNLFDSMSVSLTSNSVSTPQESKGVNNDKVIAPGMFRFNPSKTSRVENHVPNTVSTSVRTKPVIVSQPHVITKKDMNSDLNGLSSTVVDNTKTRRPHPRSNTKHDRVPSASKSSRNQNKEAKVEEHHRNLLLSKNNKHISSACNNIKIDSHDVISKAICAMLTGPELVTGPDLATGTDLVKFSGPDLNSGQEPI
nr:hypothetical protein [Tanacetum cinerariifolium]